MSAWSDAKLLVGNAVGWSDSDSEDYELNPSPEDELFSDSDEVSLMWGNERGHIEETNETSICGITKLDISTNVSQFSRFRVFIRLSKVLGKYIQDNCFCRVSGRLTGYKNLLRFVPKLRSESLSAHLIYISMVGMMWLRLLRLQGGGSVLYSCKAIIPPYLYSIRCGFLCESLQGGGPGFHLGKTRFINP